MVIKLKGADFSENNLGKIVVSEISEETKNILKNYTKRLTQTQKFAFQDFLDGLKNYGIWENISNLYLPILAGDKTQALYNIKTCIYDATPNENYELINNGLKAITNKAGTSVKYTGANTNLHLAVYNTTDYSLTTDEHIFYYDKTVDGTRQFIDYFIKDATGAVAVKTNDNIQISNANTVVCDTKKIHGVFQTTGSVIFRYGEKSSTMSSSALSETTNYNDVDVLLLNSISQSSYGLISMGSFMDSSLQKKFFELVSTLMECLNV